MKLDVAVLACMNDDELARVGDRFLGQIIAQGMTEAAMPNLALLFHQMSLAAAKWCPSRPGEQPRVVARKADNVLHVDFGSSGSRLVAREDAEPEQDKR